MWRVRAATIAASAVIVGVGAVVSAAILGDALAACHVPSYGGLREGSLCADDVWGHPAVPLGLLALSVLVVAAWTIGAIGSGLRQIVGGRRLYRRLLAGRIPHPLSEADLEGCREVVVIDADLPLAMTVGQRHRRVLVSTHTIDALDPACLTAVLAHEQHHARNRHPTVYAMMRAAARAQVLIPVVRAWAERGIAEAEIAADEVAVAVTDRQCVAAALLHFEDADGFAHAAIGSASAKSSLRSLALAGERLPSVLSPTLVVRSLAGIVVTLLPVVALVAAVLRSG